MTLYPLDRFLAGEAQDSAVRAIDLARDASRALSAGGRSEGWLLASGPLWETGSIAGHGPLADTGPHAAEAILQGDALTRVVKGVSGRTRPRVDVDAPRASHWAAIHDYLRFPSDHATAGCAAASALTSEVSRHGPRATWIVGPGPYATAALVGISRMYDNQHRASDGMVAAARCAPHRRRAPGGGTRVPWTGGRSAGRSNHPFMEALARYEVPLIDDSADNLENENRPRPRRSSGIPAA